MSRGGYKLLKAIQEFNLDFNDKVVLDLETYIKMLDEIVIKTILTVVGFAVTGLLGYLVAKIKEQTTKQKKAIILLTNFFII